MPLINNMEGRMIVRNYIVHPIKSVVDAMFRHGALEWLGDEAFLKLKGKNVTGKWMDLKNPKTFNEKLQWLKIHDRREIYTTMVDKYEAKGFIASKVGSQHVIPTYGVWEDFSEIDFDLLPNEFILKTTHDSGCFEIVKEKSEADFDRIRETLTSSLNQNHYSRGREWPYKNVKPRIIAEKLLVDSTCSYLKDYKFYCFNGEAKLFYITSNKGIGHTYQNFFDLEGNPIEIQDKNYPNNPNEAPSLPKNLELMITIANTLSENIPHLRVDIYEVDGNVYVGELTFCEASGFCQFTPDKYNRILGDWIDISRCE